MRSIGLNTGFQKIVRRCISFEATDHFQQLSTWLLLCRRICIDLSQTPVQVLFDNRRIRTDTNSTSRRIMMESLAIKPNQLARLSTKHIVTRFLNLCQVFQFTITT